MARGVGAEFRIPKAHLEDILEMAQHAAMICRTFHLVFLQVPSLLVGQQDKNLHLGWVIEFHDLTKAILPRPVELGLSIAVFGCKLVVLHCLFQDRVSRDRVAHAVLRHELGGLILQGLKYVGGTGGLCVD